MITNVFPVPSWALSYLINADPSGLDDSELAAVDAWQKSAGVLSVCVPESETAYFEPFPAFGPAADVFNCECVLSWD